jgi:hypothetical protein
MMRWAGVWTGFVRTGAWLAAVIAAAAFAAAARAQDRSHDKVALVIGNSQYVNVDPLPNPVNDARAVAQALRDIGFDVSDGYDLTRDGMEQQVRAFLRKTETASLRVFYYAGHGLQVDDRNYLAPVNTRLERASDLGFETISLDSILENLDSPSRTNVIILDACRNNPFAKAFTARGGAGRAFNVSRGLAPSNPGGGTLIAYSTKPGAVALDGSGANSPFTEALTRHLRTPGLEVRQMLTRVRADVIAATRGEQYPWDNSGLLSDVYLAGTGNDGGQIARPSQPSGPDAADLVWDTIRDSGSATAFETFAAKFPASPHAREALARAGELKKKEQHASVATLPPAGAAQTGNQANAPSDVPYPAFMWSNTGWMMQITTANIPSAISWRLGDTGEFQETGLLETVNPLTGRRMPNPVVDLGLDQKAARIWVRYADSNGVQHGPFPIAFDPSAELVRSGRSILERTPNAWMQFGKDSNASILYYTHLVTYRCAIRQVRIGIDSVAPNEILQLPPCDEKAPMEISSGMKIFLKVPVATAMVSVELTYQDGTVSKIKTINRR